MAVEYYIPDGKETGPVQRGPRLDFLARLRRFFASFLPSPTEVLDNTMMRDIEAFDQENPRWDYDQRHAAALQAYRSGLPVGVAEDLYDVSLSDQTELTLPSERA